MTQSNNLKTFGANYNTRDINMTSSMVDTKVMGPMSSGGGVAVNGNIMTASTVVTSLDEECTTIPVTQLMLKRYKTVAKLNNIFFFYKKISSQEDILYILFPFETQVSTESHIKIR